MFPISQKYRLVGSVLSIGINKDSLIGIDNFYNVSVFSLQDRILLKSLQLSKSAEPLHHFSKSVAISNQTAKVAVGFEKTPKGIILNATHKSIAPIATLQWQKLEISKIAFSHDDNYLATGGQDGRVLVYSDKYNLLLGLPPFPDYISAIDFSDDENLIFAACFDKSAVIFSIQRNILIASFHAKAVIEDAFFFDGNSKLFYITKEGDAVIYDITKGEEHLAVKLYNAWPTICIKDTSGEYAIIGAKDAILRLVRLSDLCILESINLDHVGITSMCLHQNMLYVGYSDGNLQIANLEVAKDEILVSLQKDDLIEALSIINEKNIFLKILPEYIQKVESLWKTHLAQAIDLLAKDQIQEATEVVSPFMSDKAKKEEFDYYWQQKESVAHFMDAIEAKNYSEAYKLVDAHKHLKETIAYEQLEDFWNKCFELAKRLLMQDASINLPKAQSLLKPFSLSKAKKESVTTLLNNTDKYLQAEKEYRSKNLVEYFRLCDKFTFLKETTIYKSALFMGDQILQRINALENDGNFPKALEVCKILSGMSPFKFAANDRIKKIQIKQDFIKLCTERKLSAAFEAAENNHELKTLPECSELYNEFKIKAKNAMEFAYKGDGKSVLDTMKEYVFIEYWKDKIASMLKIAYLTEFMANSPRKDGVVENVSWKESFEYYIERFGKDEEIKKVADEMGLLEVLNSIPREGNAKGYLTAIVADSLLCIDEQPLHEYKDAKDTKHA